LPDTEIVLITSITSNVTRERAISMFRGRIGRFRHGRLRLAVDFYIPYRFFKLTWGDARKRTTTYFAADAVTGALDLIEFKQLPVEQEMSRLETDRFVDARVNDEEATRLVRERLMRFIFMKGFFKLSRVEMDVELVASLHIPYWVGVYEKRGAAHLEVINALRGSFEGGKLRDLLEEWVHP
jgi:hypothetical protein